MGLPRGPAGWVLLALAAGLLGALASAQAVPRPQCAGCDWTQGYWALDRALPRYNGTACPYVRSSQKCALNGRKDLKYQRWRWRPAACALAPMTPRALAALLQNQLVVVAGDSVSKNLGAAIACLLNAASPRGLVPFDAVVRGRRMQGYEEPQFKVRLVTFFSNTLMAASDLPGVRKAKRVDLDRLDPNIQHVLPAADVIIFMAAAWWTNPQNVYYRGNLPVRMAAPQAYLTGLLTLQRYLKTAAYRGKALLMSPSPTHYVLPRGLNTAPFTCRIRNPLGLRQTQFVAAHNDVTTAFLRMQRAVTALPGSPLQLLDITRMSMPRADAHVNGFGNQVGVRDDCRHWCEAGVPDAWVEVLYNKLLCQKR